VSSPRVSVIIPAYNSEATIAATLEALGRQNFEDFETIVVDSSPGEATAELMAERFSEVTFHHSGQRLLPHAARNRGIELANGDLLVFSDPDCVARPDWLTRLVAAHEQGHAVVGGAIETEGGWLEQGIHLSKFSAWTSGGSPGPRDDLATANVLWTRSLMERVGPFSTDRWSGDTELSWRARSEGIELRFEPAAVVSHAHDTGLRAAWRERYVRGEDFAEMRMNAERWSRSRAAAHLLAVPLMPVLLLGRALARARRGRDLRRAILTAPIQLFAYLGWSLGEGRAFARAALR
jgi:GT2 family glycosyltransferase